MGFHAEIPRVAFLGLAHLGVSFLFGILCGGGRSNDGGIHDGAFSHEQFALLLSSRPTSSKSCLVKSCSSSRWRKWSSVVASGTDSTLRSIRVRVRIAWSLVDRVFERFVRQPIPLLEKVDAQHALDTDRRTPPPGLRIVRFDHPLQSLPWHHGIHLCQKAFTTCDLLLSLILTLRKTDLLFHAPTLPTPPHPDDLNQHEKLIKSAFPYWIETPGGHRIETEVINALDVAEQIVSNHYHKHYTG